MFLLWQLTSAGPAVHMIHLQHILVNWSVTLRSLLTSVWSETKIIQLYDEVS